MVENDHKPVSGIPESPDPSRASGLKKFFFLRTTFGLLLIMILVVGGLITYPAMVKEAVPDLEIPQAIVSTEWPGADPETIEQSITDKIEKEIKSLKNLKRFRSASFDSFSIVAIEFDANADMGESMQRLREKVRDAEPELPREAEKPKIETVSVNDSPILNISIFGDMDAAILGKAAHDLKSALERASGVNKVRLGGRRKEVVHILLNIPRIYALGISPVNVAQKIQSANIDMPWDKIENDRYGSTLRLYGKFRKLDDLRELPVARLGSGRVVRLREIAKIRRDLEKETDTAFLSWKGEPFNRCIDISVTKSPGADTIKTVESLLAKLDEIRKTPKWPHGMEYRVLYRQSDDIWTKLREVFDNGWQAMLAVFIVLFFMLSWREAAVAGLSIPITFLGALIAIQLFGYTLNEMVIIGMVLALGLLVDVFILMMEGIHEGIYVEGLSFGRAALKTVKMYAGPALSGQLTTILAMAPLLAIGGIDGKFIRVIPVTTIICLVLSYIVALLIDVPCSRLLFKNVKRGVSKSSIDRLTEKVSGRLSGWSLKYTVRNRFTSVLWIAGALFLLVLSVLAFSRLPVLLYPKSDGRKLGITIELSPNTTLQTSQECAGEIGNLLRKKEYLESVTRLAGIKSPFARNSMAEELFPSRDSYIVGFSCMFTPREERDKMAFEYLDELRGEIQKSLRQYPGAQVIFTPEVGGSTTEDPVQIVVTGNDMKKLREIAGKIKEQLETIPGATDVRDNLGLARTDVKVVPNREALDFYGITEDNLAGQIRYAMANDEISKYALSGTEEDLEIRLGSDWASRNGKPGGATTFAEIMMIRAFRPDGKTVPLASLVRPVIGSAPLCITRRDGRRSVTILAKNRERTAASIIGDMNPILEEMKKTWPEEYDYAFGGEVESSSETFSSAGRMFLLAIFLVFALLVIQFNSFTQPFIIMLSIPIALTGTCGGFFLAWIPFSFPAMVGIISLAGIVVNDSIVMIETMNHYRKKGMGVRDAAARGAADRLRPIISTSVTTVVGLTPLALSNPVWMPLCSAIIFGLAFATLSAMLVIPCLYVVLTPNRPVREESLE